MSLKTQFHKYGWIVLLCLSLLVSVGLLTWLVSDVHNLYRSGMLRPTGLHRNTIRSQAITPADIQNWMTFAYINRIFHLPPNYLSESLKITDSRYPNLEINTYAKSQKLDVTALVQMVQQEVSSYSSTTHVN